MTRAAVPTSLEGFVGRSVTVSAPATVANLGAGYDVLGLALDLRNLVTARVTGLVGTGGSAVRCTIVGEGETTLHADGRNAVAAAFYRGAVAAGLAGAERLAIELIMENRIPLARGLGSSAAATIAGLVAGAALVDPARTGNGAHGPVSEHFPDDLLDALLEEGDTAEGHPDNAAAALFGGLVASGRYIGDLTARLIDVPEGAIFIVLIPDLELPTALMRAALPAKVPLADAAHNASRLAMGIAALESGDINGFALLADDRLHQQYRAARYKALPALLSAATSAGAVSSCLAGAGSSVLAVVDGSARDGAQVAERVALALGEAAKLAKIGGAARRINLDVDGACIEATP
jgi:homoserine kinase